MAAGRGERMLPMTKAIPKPMAPFLSSTLLHQGYKQIEKSIEYIGITVGHHGAMLGKHALDMGISIVINSTDKGNAWWIFNSLFKYLDEPVLVLTADNICRIDYSMIYQDFLRDDIHQTCMIVGVKPIPGIDGDYIKLDAASERIITSLSRTYPQEFYASGIQVINPFAINKICQGTKFTSDRVSFSDIWEQLICMKKLFKSSVVPSRWFSVDTIDQLKAAEAYKANW